jgi:hypothetical protein
MKKPAFNILAVCILLFLSTLIWPLGSIFNRCPSKQERLIKPDRTARVARWLEEAASMLNLLFLMGLTSIDSRAYHSHYYVHTYIGMHNILCFGLEERLLVSYRKDSLYLCGHGSADVHMVAEQLESARL